LSSSFEPPDRTELSSKYSKNISLYKQLIEEICFVLEKTLRKEGIEIHNMQHRLKDFDSFYDKIIRYKITDDPFERINDIAGVRIVCLYRKDLERVREVISKEFDIIESDIKTKAYKETEFGYMSDHYLVRLSKRCKGPRYDEIKLLKCEIQVRTILMDAWDSISHHLDYKQAIDIPSQLRKDFFALCGLFYVADTHFEMFRDSVEELKKQLNESVERDQFDLKQEMNLDTLIAYLRWKLPNRKQTDIKSRSELLSELEITGYSQFKKLDEALNTCIRVVEIDEKEHPPKKKVGKKLVPTKYTDVGIVRDCLEIFDHAYFRSKFGSWPERAKQIEKYRAMIRKR